MSTTIDQKVVEMTFDNKNFENNVKTSIFTLDKLKNALKFDGASKGLENIQTAAKNVNFEPLLDATDKVTQRFSYMQMTVQHQINRMVDSVVNAGERMATALTITPVKSGFSEYETQINAVQTILANTSHNGTTLDEVNEALDTLNKYADMTIYNFTEMTRNIGTFTAAGVDLQTSVDSIQGIANLAAVSGSTSQQASNAMYQLSQALAAGKVNLMDWNSVVHAGMGGKVFQDALIRTSNLLDTGADKAIKASGNFTQSLTKSGWLTTEVLTETLKQFSGAYSEADLIAQGYTKDQAKAIVEMADTATDAATKVKTFTQLWDTLQEVAQSGWTQTWELIIGDFEEAKELLTSISDSIGSFINKTSDARNALIGSALGKGFTDLKDKINKVLEPAKKMTDTVKDIGDTASKVTDTIADMGNIVNQVIKGNYGNGQVRYNKLTEEGYNWMRVQNEVNKKLNNSKRYTDEQIAAQDKLIGVQNKTTESTKKVKKETSELTKEQKKRIKELAKLTEKDKEFAELSKEQVDALNELKKTASDLGIPFDDFIDQLDEINGRWLLINSFKNTGKSIVAVFTAIGKGFREIFEPIKPEQIFNAIAGIHKFTTSLIPTSNTCEKISRIFKGLFSILHAVSLITGGALRIGFTIVSKILSAFGTDVLEVIADIADIITTIHDWIFENSLLAKGIDNIVGLIPKMVDGFKSWLTTLAETTAVQTLLEHISKIKDVFSELGSIDFSFDSIAEWAGKLKDSFLDLLSSMPDVLKQIWDFVIKGIDEFTGGGATKVLTFFNTIYESSEFSMLVSALQRIGELFADIISPITDVASDIYNKASEIGSNVIEGLQNGLSGDNGNIILKIIEVAANLINAFCDMLGIHSPSTVAFGWGKYILEGLALGLLAYIGLTSDAGQQVIDSIKGIFEGSKLDEIISSFTDKIDTDKLFDFTSKIGEAASKIDWGKLFLGGISIALFTTLNSILSVFKNLTSPMEGITKLCESFGSTIEKIGNSYANQRNSDALLKTAISIGILVAAITALVYIAGDNYGKIWNAVGVIAVLAVILAGLSIVIDKMGSAAVNFDAKAKSFKLDGLKQSMISLGIAIALMAVAIKLIGGLDADEAKQGFIGLAEIMISIITFMGVTSLISKKGGNINDLGKTMKQMAVSMLLMLAVVKLSSMMDPADAILGLAMIEAFTLIIIQMGIANRIAGKNANNFGKNMKQLAAAMLLMLAVVKLSSMMEINDIIIGLVVIEAFILIIIQMGIANRIAGKNVTKFGSTVIKMVVSIALLVGLSYLISKIDVGTIIKGMICVQAFILLLGEMLLISRLGTETKNVGSTVVSMAIAIGIMAGVCILLSAIDVLSLAKGITAVGLLSLIMSGMMYAAKNIDKSMGSIIAMSVAIAIMAGTVALLAIMKTEKLFATVGALSILMVAFSTMAKLSSGFKGSLGLIGGLLSIMLIVTLLSGLLVAINLLNVQGSLETVASISLLLVAMSATCKILSGVSNISARALIAMGTLTLIVGALSLVLLGINKLDIQGNMSVVTSLSLLLLTMTGVTAALSLLGPASSSAIAGAIGLAGVIAITAGIMIALGALTTYIPEVESLLNNGIPVLEAIGEGLGRFIGGIVGGIGSGLCDQLPSIGESISSFANSLSDIDATALTGAATLAGVIAAISGASIVDSIASFLNFGVESPMEQFKNSVLQLVDVIVAVSDKVKDVTINEEQLESVAKAGTLFTDLVNSIPSTDGWIQKITGVKDLGKYGTDIGKFIDEIKKVNDAIGDDYTFNTEAFKAFKKVGKMFADLINSIPSTDGWLQTISGIKSLGNFGDDISSFIEELKMVNDELGENYVFYTDTFKAFKKVGKIFADLINSIPSTDGWLQTITGVKSLGNFGTDISKYVKEIKKVNDTIGPDYTFNEAAFDSLKTAGEKMAELQDSLTGIEGVIGWFKGQQDLGTFGTNIGYYADSIAKLSEITITEEKINSIMGTSEAILALNETLPKEGFFDSKISMTEFSDYINDFASALESFNNTATNLNAEGINVAMSAAERIRRLIDLVANIDVSGVSTFTGIGTGGIGADGPAYKIGKAIAKFSDTVTDINTEAVSVAVTAATKIKTLISNLVGLDYSGIESFKPDKIGEAINEYASTVKGIDTSTISKSISIATRLKMFISELAGIDSSGVTSFHPGLLGRSISNYATSVGNIDLDVINSSIAGANKIKDFIVSLSGMDTSGVNLFTSSLSSLSETNISGAMSSLNESTKGMSSVGATMIDSISKGMTSKTSSLSSTTTNIMNSMTKSLSSKSNTLQSIGISLMTNFINGIKSKSSQVANAATSGIASAVASIRSRYNSMSSAGQYLGIGLVQGINSKKQSVYNAGYALGQAAVQGEKDGQKSKSPSKLTIQAGKWLGEGLVIGIGSMISTVSDSGKNLGETATKALSSAVSKVTDMVGDGFDTSPTIRPVLDLSDVEYGISTMNNMLDMDSTVGVMANVHAIGSTITSRNQNGTNADVVTAINKLGKQLNNNSGNTYNVNGVTYDDESNVSDAIKTIIRAARVERRI